MLALAGVLLASFVTAAAAAPKPPAPPAAVPVVRADRDGDKVFDDLEARLARVGAAERVDVIVTLAERATDARVADLSRRAGGFTASRRFSVVDGFATSLTRGQVEALTHVPWVVQLEEDAVVHALNDGAQTSFGVAAARAAAPALDGDGDGNLSAYSGADLVAAVLDTGIDARHLDLDGGKVLAFKDFVNGQSAPYDDNGHGTHVAATIAGDGGARTDRKYKGVAPGAGLVGVKVLSASGSGTMSGVTAAIDWVVANKDVYGIEAINLSLGAAGCSDGTDATSRAVDAAAAAGLVVAVAAGNEGPGACTIGSPGAAAGALTVGAMADTSALGFRQAYFSSRGPTADGRIKPDVSAPGVDVTSAKSGTTTGYATMSGTSMATPFVAGVALLMLDANPALGAQAVRDLVRATAVDWGRGGDDAEYGAGRLDAHAALAAAGAPLAAPPAVPAHELREGALPATGASVDYGFDVTDLRFPIAATLVHADVQAASALTPDFDLALYAPDGTRVAAAETSARQEDLAFRPTVAGAYTIRVFSYLGSGAYVLDVSAGLDRTAPAVASVSPADGATGMARTAAVSVAFSEPMDAAATQAAFSLVRAADGAAVTGSFSWSGATMTFTPAGGLSADSEYLAQVTTGARDAAGNPLAAQRSWRFATAASATTVTPSSVVLQNGTRRSGDAAALAADDGRYYEVASTSGFLARWYGRFLGVPNALTSLRLTYAGKTTVACTQTITVYRWTDRVWVTADSRAAGTAEGFVTVAVPGAPADFVSGTSGNGEVRVRVQCLTKTAAFVASGDLLTVTYER